MRYSVDSVCDEKCVSEREAMVSGSKGVCGEGCVCVCV